VSTVLGGGRIFHGTHTSTVCGFRGRWDPAGGLFDDKLAVTAQARDAEKSDSRIPQRVSAGLPIGGLLPIDLLPFLVIYESEACLCAASPSTLLIFSCTGGDR